MIHIELDTPPSLHARELREALRLQCQAKVPVLEPRIYTVGFTLYGHYYHQGQPTERDADNIVKVVLDEIAKAGGLMSRRGKRWSDRWLQRRWSGLDVVECEREYAVITLD